MGTSQSKKDGTNQSKKDDLNILNEDFDDLEGLDPEDDNA